MFLKPNGHSCQEDVLPYYSFRLQNWGGVPHHNGMIPEAIPQWLQIWIEKVSGFQAFSNFPNHVLINEYKPNEGIMPHLDGPLYSSTIATINLGSHTVLNFYKSEEREKIAFSLFLEPRSLLIQQGDIYENYLHGIDEKDEDFIDNSMLNTQNNDFINQSLKRDTRVSLTIRHVQKISKITIKLGR
ncbi:alpha-ketoglutarate-dependent dioxygenase alkB homolog 6-like isoform X2 [Daphnia carinata]|uniref:alpha-ketoglutarate-dependent dioxygenase alkB homolog 6-like isoform X2 n=1 Tax=Daphnia carinata TaxID=120202 RepID=UPI00257FB5E2|nr:alpha-ketoglutarate-dependent dioxygenase alkB homolog 6-like isoform X2 [Daphnia carinata]